MRSEYANRGQLMNRIRELETELNEQRLAAKEEQARQSQNIEALIALTESIAHDLNNILTIILGNTEMAVAQVPIDSKLSSQLSKVMLAGERAKKLVNQVLTFSRQKEQEEKPVQVNSIVKETLKLLRVPHVETEIR